MPAKPEGPVQQRGRVPLADGAKARRRLWLGVVRSRVWTFDRVEAHRDATIVLSRGSREPIDLYIATGAILDIAEGRTPSVRLPSTWRELPEAVLTVLGLPDAILLWTGYAPDHAPADESIRRASLLAWECEDQGDEAHRAMFAEVARVRGCPVEPRERPNVVPLVELPGIMSRTVQLERERDQAVDAAAGVEKRLASEVAARTRIARERDEALRKRDDAEKRLADATAAKQPKGDKK